MARPPPSPAYLQYIDDELLRAPLLFDQMVEGTIDLLRRGMAKLGAADRSAASDLSSRLATSPSSVLLPEPGVPVTPIKTPERRAGCPVSSASTRARTARAPTR